MQGSDPARPAQERLGTAVATATRRGPARTARLARSSRRGQELPARQRHVAADTDDAAGAAGSARIAEPGATLCDRIDDYATAGSGPTRQS